MARVSRTNGGEKTEESLVQQKSWSALPNELKSVIIQSLDLQTSLSLMACGPLETALVRKFGKTKSRICLFMKYIEPKSKKGHGKMYIELRGDIRDNVLLTWTVTAFKNRSSKVVFINSNTRSVVVKKKPFGAVAFQIVRRLFSDPMFEVSHFELFLDKFKGRVNLESVVVNLNFFTMSKFITASHVRDIFSNNNIKSRWIACNYLEDPFLIVRRYNLIDKMIKSPEREILYFVLQPQQSTL